MTFLQCTVYVERFSGWYRGTLLCLLAEGQPAGAADIQGGGGRVRTKGTITYQQPDDIALLLSQPLEKSCAFFYLFMCNIINFELFRERKSVCGE